MALSCGLIRWIRFRNASSSSRADSSLECSSRASSTAGAKQRSSSISEEIVDRRLAQPTEGAGGYAEAGGLAPGERDRVGLDAVAEQDELVGLRGHLKDLAAGEAALGEGGAGGG